MNRSLIVALTVTGIAVMAACSQSDRSPFTLSKAPAARLADESADAFDASLTFIVPEQIPDLPWLPEPDPEEASDPTPYEYSGSLGDTKPHVCAKEDGEDSAYGNTDFDDCCAGDSVPSHDPSHQSQYQYLCDRGLDGDCCSFSQSKPGGARPDPVVDNPW